LTSFVHIDRAARIVLEGGVVAYPTEAVYGLGCLPGDANAVERILRIKRRSSSKGLILIAATIDQLAPLVVLPGTRMRAEIDASWPGPATWVLPARPGVPSWLMGKHRSLAVRVTAHPVARRLCERVGSALVSTSANRSGRPPHRRALGVRCDLGREIDYVLVGALGGAARPTVIRDGQTGRVLRAG
jgi:L-threonylcarbamoyladenylate synthase